MKQKRVPIAVVEIVYHRVLHAMKVACCTGATLGAMLGAGCGSESLVDAEAYCNNERIEVRESLRAAKDGTTGYSVSVDFYATETSTSTCPVGGCWVGSGELELSSIGDERVQLKARGGLSMGADIDRPCRAAILVAGPDDFEWACGGVGKFELDNIGAARCRARLSCPLVRCAEVGMGGREGI